MSQLSPMATWDAYSLLEPEVLLPSQMHERPKTRNAEMQLLWAVLIDGVQTYCREILRKATSGLTYRETDHWIFRPASDALTSFSNLCSLFEIDARKLRRSLLEFRDRPTDQASALLQQLAA